MQLDRFPNIPAAFLDIAGRTPSNVVYAQPRMAEGTSGDPLKTPARPWITTNYATSLATVKRIAAYLISLGLNPGDRVAIISSTRPEWLEADLAILCAGCISVSVYPSLTAQETGFILFDSGAQVIFAENQEQIDKLAALNGKPFGIPASEERPAGDVTISIKRVITFEETSSALPTQPWATIPSFEGDPFTRINDLERDDIASLVYTSGTTGAPKGVIQTHGNHLANVRQAYNAGIYGERNILMLFLPLAHSFAKLMGYIGFLTSAELRFTAVSNRRSSKFDPRSISKDISEAGSEIITVVPRLLEKMQSGILEKAHASGMRAALLNTAISSALERAKADRLGQPVSLGVQIKYLLTATLRRAISRKLFGSRFRYAVSGGAKLPVNVAQFFADLGMEVLEGYGLTETCVATNVNRLGKKRIGSVGPVLDADIELRIASDSEILFRGPNITGGYYQRPTATSQAWDEDGWFHTGDLGRIDGDGFLWIEGRKKELIITAGGKKIPPDPIEQRIKECALVSQAMLIGEGKPYCAALITLNEELVRGWGNKSGLALDADLSQDPQVYAQVWAHIEKLNSTLASYESIKKILILPEDFTQDNELLTPTFKVRRKAVAMRFADEIEGVFGDASE